MISYFGVMVLRSLLPHGLLGGHGLLLAAVVPVPPWAVVRPADEGALALEVAVAVALALPAVAVHAIAAAGIAAVARGPSYLTL